MSAPTTHRGKPIKRSTPYLSPVLFPTSLESIRAAELTLLNAISALGWEQRRLAAYEARLADGDTRQARTKRSGTIASAAGQCRRKIDKWRMRVAEAELAHQRAWSEAIAEACSRPATTPLATVQSDEDGEE
jgi:hypothetical protein